MESGGNELRIIGMATRAPRRTRPKATVRIRRPLVVDSLGMVALWMAVPNVHLGIRTKIDCNLLALHPSIDEDLKIIVVVSRKQFFFHDRALIVCHVELGAARGRWREDVR